MGEKLHWLNMVVAGLGSLAAFGSFNKMQWGKTKPCLIIAMLLIAVGLAGQWLQIAQWLFAVDAEPWLQHVDSALYCGVLALLLSSQRVHEWILERFSNPIATVVGLLGVAVLLVGLLGGCDAHAQELDKPTLVIALDRLDNDRVYGRTVMVAVPFRGGHAGVILNRPTQVTMQQIFPGDALVKDIAEPAFFGGPAMSGRMLGIVMSEESPGEGSVAVTAGVWMVLRAEVLDAFIAKSPNAARYYMGMVLWRPGELADEIRRGMVMVRNEQIKERIFQINTEEMYEQLVTPNRKPALST